MSHLPLSWHKWFWLFTRFVVAEVRNPVRDQPSSSVRKYVTKFCHQLTLAVIQDSEAAAQLREPEYVHILIQIFTRPGVLRQVKEPLLSGQVRTSEGEHFAAGQSSIGIKFQAVPGFSRTGLMLELVVVRDMKCQEVSRLAIILCPPLARP